jgi:hypothetical protein
VCITSDSEKHRNLCIATGHVSVILVLVTVVVVVVVVTVGECDMDDNCVSDGGDGRDGTRSI